MNKYLISGSIIFLGTLLTFKLYKKIKKIYRIQKDKSRSLTKEKTEIIESITEEDFTKDNDNSNSEDLDIGSNEFIGKPVYKKKISEYNSIYGLGFGNENTNILEQYLISNAIKDFGSGNVIICETNNQNYNISYKNLLFLIRNYTGIIGYFGSCKILEPMKLEKDFEDINLFDNLENLENPNKFNKIELEKSIRDKIYFSSSIKYITIGHLIKSSFGLSNNISQYNYSGIKLHDIINKDTNELILMLKQIYIELGLDKYPRNIPLYTIEQTDIFSKKIYIDIDYKTLFSFEYDIKNILKFRSNWKNIVDPLYFKNSLLDIYNKFYLCIISNSTLLDQVNGFDPLAYGSGTPTAILDSLALNFSDKMIKNLVNYGVINSFTIKTDSNFSNKFNSLQFVKENNIEWLDIELLNYGIKISAPNRIVITGLDQLANYSGTIKIFSSSVKYDNLESKYVEVDNWYKFNFSNVKTYMDLHWNIKRYVQIIENMSQVNIWGISILGTIITKN